ncbi:hypothetical protein [Mesorhizobium tamadayense]
MFQDQVDVITDAQDRLERLDGIHTAKAVLAMVSGDFLRRVWAERHR